MERAVKHQHRIQDKIRLTLRVSYFASISSLVFGLICLFFLDVFEIVPHIFLAFGALSIINNLAYASHQNLTLTYNILSILGLASATAITMLTGGINSPFIFVLAIVVFAGYATTRNYGKIYLYLTVLIIALIFVQEISVFSLTRNVIPEESRDLFSFLSVIFSVYLLGGVLGKNLLKAHHTLHQRSA